MRLMLTSDGLSNPKLKGEFLRSLNKNPRESSVLIIAGLSKRKYFKYFRAAKDIFVSLGIKKITLANISNPIKAKEFGNFDVVLFMGGNTFYLLDRARKTGFISYIKNHVRKNNVYIGISAGSIIVHKSIEIAGWGTCADPNLIGLSDLTGIGLTNLAVYPHYKRGLEKEIKSFKINSKYRIQEIKDGEAVLINGSKVKIIRK